MSVGLKTEDKLELHGTVDPTLAIFPVQPRIALVLKVNISTDTEHSLWKRTRVRITAPDQSSLDSGTEESLDVMDGFPPVHVKQILPVDKPNPYSQSSWSAILLFPS